MLRFAKKKQDDDVAADTSTDVMDSTAVPEFDDTITFKGGERAETSSSRP